MILEDAFKELLAAIPALSSVSGRIYPGVAPESADYPLITFRPPEGDNRQIVETLDGGDESTRIRFMRETIRIFSSSRGLGAYLEAALLDDAIFEYLFQRNQTIVVGTAFSPTESIQIQRCVPTERCHSYLGYHDQTQTHHFLSEFHVHYIKP